MPARYGSPQVRKNLSKARDRTMFEDNGIEVPMMADRPAPARFRTDVYEVRILRVRCSCGFDAGPFEDDKAAFTARGRHYSETHAGGVS